MAWTFFGFWWRGEVDVRELAPPRARTHEADDIRPEAWTFSEELLLLLSILEHTVNATPKAAELLEQVLGGPLIRAEDLPTPTDAERKAPRT